MSLSNQQFAPLENELKFLIDGNIWSYSTDFVIDAEGSLSFHIKTGDKDVIITGANAGSFGGDFELVGFSDSTVSSNGSEVLAKNNNRQSSKKAITKLFSNPTITDYGVEIVRSVSFGGINPAKTYLSEISAFKNYILNRNSSNIFRLTNRDTNSDVKVSMNLTFIEVEL